MVKKDHSGGQEQGTGNRPLLFWLIGLLCAFQILTLYTCLRTTRELKYLRQDVQGLHGQIQMVHIGATNGVPPSQSGIIEDATCTFGPVDLDARVVEMTVSFVLTEYQPDTQVQLLVDGTRVDMQRKNVGYSVTVPMNPFRTNGLSLFALVRDDTLLREEFITIADYNWRKALPQLDATSQGDITVKDNGSTRESYYTGEIQLLTDASFAPEDWEQIRLIVTVDREVVHQEDVTDVALQEKTIACDQLFLGGDYQSGQVLQIKLEAKDRHGIVRQIILNREEAVAFSVGYLWVPLFDYVHDVYFMDDGTVLYKNELMQQNLIQYHG